MADEFVFPQDTWSPIPAHEVETCQSEILERKGGLTLRDYFAACSITPAHDTLMAVKQSGSMMDVTGELLAKYCYEMADAMLRAREK